MKSRILSAISVVALIAFVLLLFGAAAAYPMHIGEPSWYHACRVDCVMAAAICGLVSFVAATVAALCKSK